MPIAAHGCPKRVRSALTQWLMLVLPLVPVMPIPTIPKEGSPYNADAIRPNRRRSSGTANDGTANTGVVSLGS